VGFVKKGWKSGCPRHLITPAYKQTKDRNLRGCGETIRRKHVNTQKKGKNMSSRVRFLKKTSKGGVRCERDTTSWTSGGRNEGRKIKPQKGTICPKFLKTRFTFRNSREGKVLK